MVRRVKDLPEKIRWQNKLPRKGSVDTEYDMETTKTALKSEFKTM